MNQVESKSGFVAECEYCHSRFQLNKDNVIQKSFESKGQSILLTYYDCPDCSGRHYVQIDDEKSGYKLQDCKMQMTKLMARRRKGKYTEKQNAAFKKARKDLADYRMNLMKEFQGEAAKDENGIEFELRFSV